MNTDFEDLRIIKSANPQNPCSARHDQNIICELAQGNLRITLAVFVAEGEAAKALFVVVEENAVGVGHQRPRL